MTAALTPKQRAFVAEYTLDRNGAAAARRAGYSERRAAQTAHELLADPTIAAAIEGREEDIANELGITRERIIRGFDEAWKEARTDRNWAQVNRSLENLARLTGMMDPAFTDPGLSADVDASIRNLIAELERNDP